ncbi:peroxiredoxin [Asaia spathodeae]|uniref:thioredoxin-dependent peroxiredoxin n=1 Tax=Asaia spathodeae TaxID=657016 RepID=A0ABX2NZX4_9PROT|nr:peroxiredoxin [Asaia spathodeae]GBR15477.1 thioredoxin peroxidase [Asaia spathodeae NBRC 105894]
MSRRLAFVPLKTLLGLSLILAAPAAKAELKQGAEAPNFTLPATQNGKEVQYTLRDALAKGPVVLYFYPAAFTKGCTMEAHGFADAMPQFTALGASVIGVSMDKISKLDDFSVSQIKGQFPVASDSEGKVTRLYDAKMPMLDIAQRVTYVIAPEGQIIATISSESPGNHVEKALAALKTFKADTMKNRKK